MEDTFNFDAKAGNRASRRAARALGNLGRRIGRGIARQEPFDPNAEDGDGDGLVQDGSIWERPPGVNVANVGVGTVSRAATGDQEPEGASVPQSSDRPDIVGDEAVVEAKRPGIRPYNMFDREDLLGRTPEEIAELIVPSSRDEFIEQSIAVLTGSPSQYADQDEYENARAIAMARIRERIKNQSKPVRFIARHYVQNFGRDAWERDAIDNPSLYQQRLEQLFGNPLTEIGLSRITQDHMNRRKQAADEGMPNFLNPNSNEVVIDPDFTPETVTLLKQRLAKTLRDNPALLDMFQRYGAPPIYLNHARSSDMRKVKNALGGKSNIFGITMVGYMKGTQGFYDRSVPAIALDLAAIERNASIEPTGVSVSNPDAVKSFGDAGLFAHEYGHYISHMLKMSFAQLLRRMRKQGILSNEDVEAICQKLDVGLQGHTLDGTPVFIQFHKFFGSAIGRGTFDINNPEQYGFANQEEMYETLRRFLHAFYTDLRGLEERAQTDTHSGKARRALLDKYRDKDSVLHMSRYSTTIPEERWAETMAAALIELANTLFPVFTNDYAIKLIAEALGFDTENNGVNRISRIDKESGSTQDISNSRLSRIRLIPRAMKRGPDGRRITRAMGLDADDRSTMRNPLSNIDPLTDQRLYGFDEPITVSDYRSRSRAYSIGDHRFYDVDTPNGYAIGTQRTMTRGWLAARRFINPSNPHYADMVRAVSSTQLGFFVDDMPVYDGDTSDDTSMLRGLITGNIADLPLEQRREIERAVIDATRISEAVQASERGKKYLYRTSDVDPQLMLNSITKGDTFPLPITAFTDVKPDGNQQVVIRLMNGSKSIDAGENEFLTQGTYEVVDITDDGTQVVVSLEHKETFDPRHDAMRPVDRFSDRPGAMRKRGSSKPRYTRQEASLMEADLERRRALNEADRGIIIDGLASRRESGGLTPQDKVRGLINGFLAVDRDIQPLPEEQRQGIVEQALIHVKKLTEKRLDKAKAMLRKTYGTREPWVEDREAMRRLFDPSIESTQNRKDLMLGLRKATTPVLQDLDPDGYEGHADPDLTEGVIRGMLNGQFTYEDADYKVAVPITLTPEQRKIAIEMLNGLEAVRRAYGDTGEIFTLEDGRQIRVNIYNANKSNGEITDGAKIKVFSSGEFQVMILGEILVKRPQDEDWDSADYAGEMNRTLFPSTTDSAKNPGRIAIVARHETMMLSVKSEGLGNFLNQHAYLWYQQTDRADVNLSAMFDGPIVWPRMGFEPENADIERLEGFAFQQLRNWLDGKPSAVPDEAHAIRLAAWVNMRMKNDERATASMLANSLDFRSLPEDFDSSYTQDAWRDAFEKNFDGDNRFKMRIELDDSDFDDDYKPSFIIVDDPQRFKRDLSVASQREGNTGVYRYLGTWDEPITKEAASRLAIIADMSLNNAEARSALYDQSGYTGSPQLISIVDLKDALESGDYTAVMAFGNEKQIRNWLTGPMEPVKKPFPSGSIDSRFMSRPPLAIDRFAGAGIDSDPLTARNGTIALIPDDSTWTTTSEMARESAKIRKALREEAFRASYKRANDIDEQIARRDEIVAEHDELAGNIIAAVYEIEDQKYTNPINEEQARHNELLSGAQRLLQEPDVMAIALGYDYIYVEDSPLPDEIGNIKILNRSAIIAVDQPMSLREVARIVDSSDEARRNNTGFLEPTRTNSPKVYRDGATDWWKDDNDTLLRALYDENPSPIALTSRSMNSQSGLRSMRQNFGIDRQPIPPSRKRARRPISTSVNGRNVVEWDQKDEKEWLRDAQDLASRFGEVTNKIDELEALKFQMEDENQPVDSIRQQIQDLNDEKNRIVDTFASMTETSNTVMEKAMRHEAAIQALENFLDDVAPNLPEEYGARAQELLDRLRLEKESNPANLDGSPTGIPSKRHKMLAKILDDNFDLRWDVEKDGIEFDGSRLNHVEYGGMNDITGEMVGDFREVLDEVTDYLYRGFFDPNFDQWETKRPAAVFSDIIAEIDATLGKERYDLQVEEMLAGIFSGVRPSDRRKWSADYDKYLDDQYNSEYEESMIDATPSGATVRPDGVPQDVWRKVLSAAERARKSPYEGERDAANEAAKRIIGRHRPDLANDDFIVGLTSMRNEPAISRGVPTFMTQTRGSAPAAPSRSKSSRSNARLVDRIRSKGIDFSEQDLLNGDAVKWLRTNAFVGATAPKDLNPSAGKPEGISKIVADAPDELKETIQVLLESITEMAVEDGFNVFPIEGHSTPKIQAPVMREIADLFGDDLDIAVIQSISAPTYEQITRAAAYALRRQNQLDKMFGSRQVRDRDGNYSNSIGDFFEFIERPGVDTGDYTEFRDSRGNLVMRLDNSIVELASGDTLGDPIGSLAAPTEPSPREVLDAVRIKTGFDSPINYSNFNHSIFQVMAERLGVDMPSEFNEDIAKLRENVKKAGERVDKIEFAPTPAGRYMQELFRSRHEKHMRILDSIERMADRQIQLWRDAGYSDEEIVEQFINPMGEIYSGRLRHRPPFGFTAPVLDAEPGAKTADMAIYAHIKMMIGGGAPLIGSDDATTLGLHELGHFGFGQAFTRHGEYAANVWQYGVFGDSFWESFAVSQQAQKTFNIFTLKEKFGRTITPGEYMAMDTSERMRSVLNRKYVAWQPQDNADFISDIQTQVDSIPGMSDEEKYELGQRVKGLGALLTPSGAPATDTSIEELLYDELVPLPAHLFGWIRSKDGFGNPSTESAGPEATEIVKQDFAQMLRVLSVLRGQMRFFGDESTEDMAMAERTQNLARRKSRMDIRTVTSEIKKVLEKHPSLRGQFQTQLQGLGIK